MLKAAAVVVQAARLWWGEVFLLSLFNLAWLALQAPIVTGPPATAAIYVIARRVADGELLTPRDGWNALRQMWRPAWAWGLANLLVIGVLVGNFWAYQAATGWGWTALRLAWGAIAVVWCAANLYYWPFWLAQHDRRLTVTLRNALVFLLRSPGLALTLAAVSAGLEVVAVATTLPLAAGLMVWLALIATQAVDAALLRSGRQPGSVQAAPNSGVQSPA
jgi:uncharacterized membrane protein YesL